MVSKIVDGSIPNPLGTRLLLALGEEVKVAFTIRLIMGRVIRKCLFVLTNRQIIFYDLELKTILGTVPLIKISEVSVEKNVLIGKEFRNTLKIGDMSAKCLIDILDKAFNVDDVAQALLKLRTMEVLRANIVEGDFSWLKSLLDRGGIVLTTVKCPSCGGILDIPNEGKFIKCKYCGQTIFVEDVINIIRGVIGLK
ncbi:MAG: hypothetical protein QXV52_08730 [Nitrososphaeria archaeon]